MIRSLALASALTVALSIVGTLMISMGTVAADQATPAEAGAVTLWSSTMTVRRSSETKLFELNPAFTPQTKLPGEPPRHALVARGSSENSILDGSTLLVSSVPELLQYRRYFLELQLSAGDQIFMEITERHTDVGYDYSTGEIVGGTGRFKK
jgi:hypothetical protein